MEEALKVWAPAAGPQLEVLEALKGEALEALSLRRARPGRCEKLLEVGNEGRNPKP